MRSIKPNSENDELLQPWRLIAWTLSVLVALFALILAAGLWFREPLFRVAHRFVDAWGGLGVALGYFVPDATNLPLPSDVVSVLAIAGGLTFLEVTAYGTAGSILGGISGYWIGRALRRTRLLTRLFERSRLEQTVRRHGLVAVALGAVTPLPFSVFCWAAGAGRLPFAGFVAVSTLRLARVAGYLYLVRLGLMTTG